MYLTHREVERLQIEILRGIPAHKSEVAMTPRALQVRAKLEAETQKIIEQGGIVEIPFDLGSAFDPTFYEQISGDEE